MKRLAIFLIGITLLMCCYLGLVYSVNLQSEFKIPATDYTNTIKMIDDEKIDLLKKEKAYNVFYISPGWCKYSFHSFAYFQKLNFSDSVGVHFIFLDKKNEKQKQIVSQLAQHFRLNNAYIYDYTLSLSFFHSDIMDKFAKKHLKDLNTGFPHFLITDNHGEIRLNQTYDLADSVERGKFVNTLQSIGAISR